MHSQLCHLISKPDLCLLCASAFLSRNASSFMPSSCSFSLAIHSAAALCAVSRQGHVEVAEMNAIWSFTVLTLDESLTCFVTDSKKNTWQLKATQNWQLMLIRAVCFVMDLDFTDPFCVILFLFLHNLCWISAGRTCNCTFRCMAQRRWLQREREMCWQIDGRRPSSSCAAFIRHSSDSSVFQESTIQSYQVICFNNTLMSVQGSAVPSILPHHTEQDYTC